MKPAQVGLWLLGASAFGAVACESNPSLQPAIGDACLKDGDCGSFLCTEGSCTNTCSGNGDCRAGTDCRWLDNRFVCAEKRWGDWEGAYTTNCTINGDWDCAGGFRCWYEEPDDPQAYCTAPCESDRDCPGDFGCVDHGSFGKECQARELCWQCDFDSDCDSPKLLDGICEDFGGVRFCSKLCDPALEETCPVGYWCDADSSDRPRCAHRAAECYGDGSTCTPCRTQEDCDPKGAACLVVRWTGERFCSEVCASDGTCPSPYECVHLGADDVPGHCVPNVTLQGSCWPPW